MRKYNKLFPLLILLMLLGVSCEWDDVDKANAQNRLEEEKLQEASDKLPAVKVAVVLPLDNSYKPRFERVAQWAMENISEATRGMSYSLAPSDHSGISIEIEWHDENVIDPELLAQELAQSEDIVAIIGPMFSSDTQVFALECAKTGMNLLLPCTTSSEVVRKFSSKPFFWSFAETDIRQCQVMLETAKNYCNCNSISLITGDGFYGQTFSNWLPFEVKEQGLTLNHIYVYEGDLDQETVTRAMQESVDGQAIICTPSEVSDVLTFQNAVKTQNPKGKAILSDIAMDPSLLDYGSLFSDALGIGITADEQSGFLEEYIANYATEPTEGECQFYDALVLMSIVASDLYNSNIGDPKTYNLMSSSSSDSYNTLVSKAMERILKPGDANELYLTKVTDIKSVIADKAYNVRGASGHIDFDKANKSSVAHSTYQLWTINGHEFSTLKYYKETPMSIDAWEAEVSTIEDINTGDVDISYPALDKQWAVLVAGSSSWSDYRHQADVLMVYNMLKDNGYPDDHIVLVMEDDIARNPANIYPGMVIGYNGVNLYDNITIDYKPSQLEPSDIARIILGRKSDKLPKVLESDNDDNILIYWVGNSSETEFNLGGGGLSNDDFTYVMQELAKDDRMCRKLLCISDASHAQAVTSLQESLGLNGILCINSSSLRESSLADQCDFDELQQTYLATHFSKVLVETVANSPSCTYYELYEKLARFTSGSHVNISNAANFGNLKRENISEFMQYRK